MSYEAVMFFTPFIGFSILVHVILILVYKTFKLKPKKYATQRRWIVGRQPDITYIFSLIIMLVVFGISLTSAGFLVEHSLRDKYSTARLVGREYKQVSLYIRAKIALTQPSNPAPDGTGSNGSNGAPTIKLGIAGLDCDQQFEQLAKDYHYSLILYLKAKGQKISFTQRGSLARKNGMIDYVGSSAQNLNLLKIMLVQFDELPSNDSPTCQQIALKKNLQNLMIKDPWGKLPSGTSMRLN